MPQKKDINPDVVRCPDIKYVNDVSCVYHLSVVQNVANAPIVAPDLPVRVRLHQFWKKWAGLGGQPQSCNIPQERVHSPLPVPAKSEKVTHQHKLLCKSPQEPLPVGAFASGYEQKCSRTGQNSEISRVLQQTIPGSKYQQPVESYTRPLYPEQVFKDRVIQNGNPRDNKAPTPLKQESGSPQ